MKIIVVLSAILLALTIPMAESADNNNKYDMNQDTNGWVDFGDMFSYDVNTKSNKNNRRVSTNQDSDDSHCKCSDQIKTSVDNSDTKPVSDCDSILDKLEICEKDNRLLNQLTQSSACNQRIMAFVNRALLKLINKFKIYEQQLNEDKYLEIATQVYDSSLLIVQTFISQNQFNCERVDELEDAICQVIDNFYLINQSKNSWFYQFIENHWLTTLLILSILLSILLIYKLYFMSLFAKMITFFVIVFIVSCFWQYIQLYQTELSKRHFTVSSAPLECLELTNNKETTITSILNLYVRSMTSMDKKCQDYYKALMVNPLFNINPLEAISHTMSSALFAPITIFMDKLGEGLSKFYLYFNYFEKILITIPLILFIALFLLLYCGFTIYFPFNMGSISRSSSRNSRYVETNRFISDYEPQISRYSLNMPYNSQPLSLTRQTLNNVNTISSGDNRFVTQGIRRSKSLTFLSRL